ncbi:MAG: hypothetical protein KY460_12390 [Actinobacteria bacterium]|nr:hypothetical protein [Actinomycetota bacterium]
MSVAGRIAAVGAALLVLLVGAVLWSTRRSGPSTEISVTVPTDRPSADSARPAPVEAVRYGGFVRRLERSPPAFAGVGGVAIITRDERGTTVTVEVTGVQPAAPLVAHVHTGPCIENGGARYHFDPGRPADPANQIALTLITDDDRQVTGDVTHPVIAGPDARSLLVTLADDPATPVACSDLGIPE